jgi:predicted kinase
LNIDDQPEVKAMDHAHAISNLPKTKVAILPCRAHEPGFGEERVNVPNERRSRLAPVTTDGQLREAYRFDRELHAMPDQIYDTLVQRASRILVQGHSVWVDAVFARETERVAIREAALKQNIRFVGFFLATDLATRQRRVRHRKIDASDATPEIAELQEQYDIGVVDWDIVDASGTPEQTLEQCQIRITRREAA